MTPRSRSRFVRAIKLTLGVIILAAVGWHVAAIWGDLHSRGESLRVDLAWLTAAIGLYLIGLQVAGIWFFRVMRATPTPIGLAPALRAYLVSHLGKYVPGKAMVVVIRAAIAASAGARTGAAVFGTLYETLVTMAAGALVATAGYSLTPSRLVEIRLGPLGIHSVSLLALSALLSALFLVVATPAVFPRLAAVASASLRGAGAGSSPKPGPLLLAEGLVLATVAWLFLGASQYAVIQALGFKGIGWSDTPAIAASVALATVAGFVVAVAPGGLGVREWVLWTSLGVVLDHERAVLAALVLRLAWLIGELIAAGTCVVLSRHNAHVQPAAPRGHQDTASLGSP